MLALIAAAGKAKRQGLDMQAQDQNIINHPNAGWDGTTLLLNDKAVFFFAVIVNDITCGYAIPVL